MIIYHIKLINPVTGEVYLETHAEKPKLPTKEDFARFPEGLLVINTDSSREKKEKKAS